MIISRGKITDTQKTIAEKMIKSNMVSYLTSNYEYKLLELSKGRYKFSLINRSNKKRQNVIVEV